MAFGCISDIDKERMEELVSLLNKYTHYYDNGNPIVSDKEWDDLYFELCELEKNTGYILKDSPTQKIRYTVVNELNKVEHNHPMLSLAKTKEIDDVIDFLGERDYIAMLKMDGLTCSLMYKDGKLVSAETRGNGIIGEDITHNAFVVDNIPKKIKDKRTIIIDGEIICTYKNFEAFSDEYKNPRNFASGSIRLLDNKECQKRKLSFIAWDCIDGLEEKTVGGRLTHLLELGFDIVPFIRSPFMFSENLGVDTLKDIAQEKGYPIDGLVFKFDDIEYGKSLGQTEHHLKNAIAFKFYDEEVETTLRDIEWTMGRTGVLTPVAIYDDVEIEGSICNRASLHNVSIMNETLGTAYIGQPIRVFKANMIIPQISWAKPLDIINDIGKGFKIIDEPCHCPICGGETKMKDNDGIITLWCANPYCDGKFINKIDHYCSKKGMDIKGLSKATIEKLINWGWISNIRELYSLDNFKKEWVNKPGFGEKSVQKILDAIENSKNCELYQFIAAISIPLIGSTVAKVLAKKFETWDNFISAIKEDYDFTIIDGFGFEMDNALKSFDYTEAKEIAKLLKFAEIQVESQMVQKASLEDLPFKNKIFVITGHLQLIQNREKLINIVEKNGGKVIGSVSKNTSVLINNDINSNSAKNKKAKELGIPIITERDFLNQCIIKE